MAYGIWNILAGIKGEENRKNLFRIPLGGPLSFTVNQDATFSSQFNLLLSWEESKDSN